MLMMFITWFNDTFNNTFNSAFYSWCYVHMQVIKVLNVKKCFCWRRRQCVRAYKLSQRHIKRNYWSDHIARAIPPCSDYSDYKPLNYDCLCLVHKSMYDIRYSKSLAQVAVFSFLVVKAVSTNHCSVVFKSFSFSLFPRVCMCACVYFLHMFMKRKKWIIKFIIK